MGLIPVNSIPTPSFAWLATRPIAEKCDSESVIVSANLPPIGKGLSVLTKHPDRLSVRTRATIVRPDSRSVSSTAPPKWWRGARRGLASRTVSISGIAVSSKHAQPISSYSRVCEIFHTVLCRALRAYDSEIRGAGILGQRSAGKPSARGRPARGTRGTGTPACARFAAIPRSGPRLLRQRGSAPACADFAHAGVAKSQGLFVAPGFSPASWVWPATRPKSRQGRHNLAQGGSPGKRTQKDPSPVAGSPTRASRARVFARKKEVARYIVKTARNRALPSTTR